MSSTPSLRGGEIEFRRAVLRVAETLDHVRAVCDRTHEENLLAERKGREAETHYAYAMGAVWMLVNQELARLSVLGVQRLGSTEQINAAAEASLEAFRRTLQRPGA